MYSLDKSVDFRFLVGKELLQLCIGLYQLILNFNDHVAITAECIIYLTKIDGSIIEISSDDPELSKNLTCLLGSTVESVATEHSGELTLIFHEGYRLTILDSNEDEESFTITTSGQEVIVK